jgi:putative heme-binding domain-containing protein
VLLCAAAALAGSASPSAQHNFTPGDVENGGRLYQSACAACHGAGGDQVPGTALRSGTFRRATTDDEIARIIRTGIPGTSMPPNPASETEAAMIVAWLRGAERLSPGGLTGDPARGKLLFDGKGKCGSCHGPDGSGSRHAPALLDIGVIRQPSELSRALLEPEADINTDFRTVRITTKSGATITGRLLNQSSYSVQILDTADRLRSFDKAGLREVIVLPTSPMPSYASTFSPQETADMVAFLSTMRGSR